MDEILLVQYISNECQSVLADAVNQDMGGLAVRKDHERRGMDCKV